MQGVKLSWSILIMSKKRFSPFPRISGHCWSNIKQQHPDAGANQVLRAHPGRRALEWHHHCSGGDYSCRCRKGCARKPLIESRYGSRWVHGGKTVRLCVAKILATASPAALRAPRAVKPDEFPIHQSVRTRFNSIRGSLEGPLNRVWLRIEYHRQQRKRVRRHPNFS